jgi:hypothetical protein
VGARKRRKRKKRKTIHKQSVSQRQLYIHTVHKYKKTNNNKSETHSIDPKVPQIFMPTGRQIAE